MNIIRLKQQTELKSWARMAGNTAHEKIAVKFILGNANHEQPKYPNNILTNDILMMTKFWYGWCVPYK